MSAVPRPKFNRHERTAIKQAVKAYGTCDVLGLIGGLGFMYNYRRGPVRWHMLVTEILRRTAAKRRPRKNPAREARVGQPCVEDECVRVAYARGWCKMHYQRWSKYGDPTMVKPKGSGLAWQGRQK